MSAPPIDAARIRLRPAEFPDDEDLLRQLYFERREDLAALPDEIRSNILEMQWAARREHHRTEFPNADHYVIVLDGQDVGEYILDRRENEIFGLDVCVRSDLRGLGIATFLIEGTKKEAAQKSIGFRYHVDIGNPARRLYDRLGFTAIGRTATNVEMEWKQPR